MNNAAFPESQQRQQQYTHQAKNAIFEFFRFRKTPFHFRQLQVLFETQFFHIATAQAIYELINEGYLQTRPFKAGANNVMFVFPNKTLSQDESRILESHMRIKAKAIALYDNPLVSKDLADHLESLVKQELRANQLTIVSTHSNTYKDRTWNKSNANLDFIADSPDGRAFGIQVKNELASIELDELRTQMEICDTLKIRPIFVVRYMPFSFVPEVTAKKGFVLTLGTQIYPLGFRNLCEQIQSKMSISEKMISKKLKTIAPKMRTTWPVEIRTELPEDACKRLSYWLSTGKLPPKSP